MANYTLTADTDLSAIPGLSNGWDIGLGGHVLVVSTDMRSVTGLKASGTGTIRLVSGGAADFSGMAVDENTITVEGGTAESPLPAHRDAPNIADNYPLRASAAIVFSKDRSFGGNVVSHCATNDDRPQHAHIASATATTLTFDTDMELEPGDVVGVLYSYSQIADPNVPPIQVTAYDAVTRTATLATSMNPVPNSSARCVLLTAAFSISTNSAKPSFSPVSRITGDELGVVFGTYGNANSFDGWLSLKRLSVACMTYPNDTGVFGQAEVNLGTYVSNAASGVNANNGFALCPFSGTVGRAWCQSLFRGFYNRILRLGCNVSRGIHVLGGDFSTYPLDTFGAAELVDCVITNPVYENIRETTELVVRTSSPETCVIHRSGGIATLVKKSGDDVVMANAPVASAYQLAPTGTDAVWHDQSVAVEAGKRLTVAWRAFCSTGAIGGVQILADSPLFGQVAVPMGAAEVLAEYSESSPPLGAWGPSRLLSWRNTSGQPVRVWVRGWGKGGTVYSSLQVVKGGQL